MGKRKITMTVDDKLFAAFKHLCTANAMKVSSRVELLMREWIEAQESPAPRTTRASKDANTQDKTRAAEEPDDRGERK